MRLSSVAGATIPQQPGNARLSVHVDPTQGSHSVTMNLCDKATAPPHWGNEAENSRYVSLQDIPLW